MKFAQLKKHYKKYFSLKIMQNMRQGDFIYGKSKWSAP